MTADPYDTAWDELNAQLNRPALARESLAPVMLELEQHHKLTGFIRDDLYDIQRFRYAQDGKHLRVQFNPRRLQRLECPSINQPPAGMTSVNDGCVLCRDNIRWQQQGKEVGYDIPGMARRYQAWMNPFPLLPCHVIVTSAEHLSQEWGLHPAGTLSVDHLLVDLVSLAQRLPGFVGFYNGVDVGASIPAHRHYHFCRRPADTDRFPLELAPRDDTRFDGTDIVDDYPLAVASWQGAADAVIDRALRWVRYWAGRNRAQLPHLGANLVVTSDADTRGITLYFAPRDRRRSSSSHLAGMVGGLEVMGEVVLSSESEHEAIDNGEIDFQALLKIYQDIYTPLFFN